MTTGRRRVVFVTDPMCSWCWGMADEFAQAREDLSGQVEFDLLLGGINTDGTQPIGDYGRRFLRRLWQEVAATTGQQFGYKLPEEYIHNSSRSCLAIEVVREVLETPPFAYLDELQRLFFVQGADITSHALLRETAEAFGVAPDRFDTLMESPRLLGSVRFQFSHARSFGTQALPSLLIENEQGALQLLAGGYVDAQMLESLLSGALAAQK